MNLDSSLDRESFQQLLANAFAVQESQVDSQSLSVIVTIQRLIAKGELGVDGAMHLIVECARNVANADGVAIGLLKGDQLVYQAGSGTAAAYIGRRRLVTLTVSANIQASREILRVENAQTDPRIEAEICRQFGAQSLMMLLICYDHEAVGVLEVLFSEPHVFQGHEVHAYRLMAGLVEDAIVRDRQLVQKRALAAQPVTMPPHTEQPVKPASLNKLRWSVAAAGVVVALVVVASWIAHNRRPASAVHGSALQVSTVSQQPTTIPAKPLPPDRPSAPQTAEGGTEDTNSASSAFKRVQVGQDEIDDIAEDVTIRHFTPKPAPPQVRSWNKQVAIGEDVTMRYYAYKSAVASPERTVSPRAPTR